MQVQAHEWIIKVVVRRDQDLFKILAGDFCFENLLIRRVRRGNNKFHRQAALTWPLLISDKDLKGRQKNRKGIYQHISVVETDQNLLSIVLVADIVAKYRISARRRR